MSQTRTDNTTILAGIVYRTPNTIIGAFIEYPTNSVHTLRIENKQ